MKRFRISILTLACLLLIVSGLSAQDPNVKHFEKDGLAFDYPAKWQFSDNSSRQMQFVELSQGDVVIRIRSEREWLKAPDKEAHAKKLFQDDYVNQFSTQLEQAGMKPTRSQISTQIAGGDAQGTRVRGMNGGESGGMDAYYRIVSDRLVSLSIVGSDKEIAASAPVLDMIRNSLKVEPPPQPKASPSPAKKP